jgi:hypothetical protein
MKIETSMTSNVCKNSGPYFQCVHHRLVPGKHPQRHWYNSKLNSWYWQLRLVCFDMLFYSIHTASMPSTAGTHTDGGAVIRRTGITKERHYLRASRSFKKRWSITPPQFTFPAYLNGSWSPQWTCSQRFDLTARAWVSHATTMIVFRLTMQGCVWKVNLTTLQSYNRTHRGSSIGTLVVYVF